MIELLTKLFKDLRSVVSVSETDPWYTNKSEKLCSAGLCQSDCLALPSPHFVGTFAAGLGFCCGSHHVTSDYHADHPSCVP